MGICPSFYNTQPDEEFHRKARIETSTRLHIITLYEVRCNAAPAAWHTYNKAKADCLTLAATWHTVVCGTTTRRLATARRTAGSTETEGGLQRIRLTRTTAWTLGLLAARLTLATLALTALTLTTLTTLTTLALTLRPATLALRARRRAFTQRTATGITADTLRTTAWTAGRRSLGQHLGHPDDLCRHDRHCRLPPPLPPKPPP